MNQAAPSFPSSPKTGPWKSRRSWQSSTALKRSGPREEPIPGILRKRDISRSGDGGADAGMSAPEWASTAQPSHGYQSGDAGWDQDRMAQRPGVRQRPRRRATRLTAAVRRVSSGGLPEKGYFCEMPKIRASWMCYGKAIRAGVPPVSSLAKTGTCRASHQLSPPWKPQRIFGVVKSGEIAAPHAPLLINKN